MKKIKRSRIIYWVIAVLTVLLNVAAWNNSAFCDAYIQYVFPLWVNTYGRLTCLFPFSVGEWLIVSGILLVLAAAVFGIGYGIVLLLRKAAPVFRRLSRKFFGFFAWVILIVCVVMTLNCSILYHASSFSEKYFGENNNEYDLEQFIKVYNFVAGECNRLCQIVPRDEDGKIVYAAADAGNDKDGRDGGFAAESVRSKMAKEAISCMQKLGETYPQLNGWYPDPKPMYFSDFMCQQYMCGYYFPFSMEANYNDVMYLMNKPATMCHELSHLRGYIFEDEANFIAYLACLQSEDPVFQYSGYLSVITYLINDLYKAAGEEPEALAKVTEKHGLVQMYLQVQDDNVFVEQEEWDRINGAALIDTEIVEEVSDTFTDTTLKLNGVSDGMVSYSRVVRLLLQYYEHVEKK